MRCFAQLCCKHSFLKQVIQDVYNLHVLLCAFMKAISVLPLNFDIMSLKKLPQCMSCGIHIKKTEELIILLLIII